MTLCLQGIVTRASLVHPKIVRSVHYCEATGGYMTKDYRDITSHTGAPTQVWGFVLRTHQAMHYVLRHVASTSSDGVRWPPLTRS